MRRKMVFILSVVFVGFISGTQSENLENNYDKNSMILKALGSVSIENIYKTRAKGSPIEEKIIRLDGKVIDLEVAGASFSQDHEGAVQIIFHDITQRKQAESFVYFHDIVDLICMGKCVGSRKARDHSDQCGKRGNEKVPPAGKFQ